MMQPDLKSLFEGFNHEADSFSGQFGLATQRLDANEPILYHAGDVFPTASVIKLVVLAEYLAQVSTGELLPDQEIVIRAKDRVGGSGVIKDLAPGLRFRLADLATLAITVSDNTAANLLINRGRWLGANQRPVASPGAATDQHGPALCVQLPGEQHRHAC
jgi:beta-lactamase class A